MKWYKFLIYFSLFASAAVNFINGLQYISGGVYTDTIQGVTADIVYDMYGRQLQTADMVYAIVLWMISVLSIVARFRLAKYKKDGPIFLYAVYIVNTLSFFIYSIAVYNLTGLTMPGSTLIIDLSRTVAIVACNYQYFTKRAALFVN